MLTFEKLLIENCGLLREAEVKLDRQGLVCLTGDNRIAGGNNMVGKSTIWEVLQFLLDGTSTKDFKPEQLVNRHHKDKGFYSSLSLKKDDVAYQIERAYKNPKFGTGIRVLKDGNEISAKTIPLAVKQVRELVGLSQQEFHNTVYLTGDYKHVLLTGKPSEKDFYFSRLFQLDVFDQMLDLVKSDLDDLREDLGKDQEKVYEYKMLKKELEDVKVPTSKDLALLKDRVAVLTKTADRLERKRTKYLRLREQVQQRKKVEHQIAKLHVSKVEDPKELKDRIRKLEDVKVKAEKAEVWEKQRRSLGEKLNSLPKVKDSLVDLKRRIERFETDLDEQKSLLPKIEERRDLLSEIKDKERHIEKLRKEHPSGSKEIQGTSDFDGLHVDSMTKELARVTTRIDEYKTRAQKLLKVKTGECPTCGSKIEDPKKLARHYEKEAERLHKEEKRLSKCREVVKKMQDVAEDIKRLDKRLKTLPDGDRHHVKKKVRKLAKYLTELRESVRVAEHRAELEEQLKEIPKPENDVIALGNVKSKLGELRHRYEKAKSYIELSATMKDLPKKGPSEKEVSAIERKITAVQESLHKARSLIEDADEKAKEFDEKKARLAKLKRAFVKIKAKKKDEEALDGLVHAFGKRGLRMKVFKRIAAVMADALPTYIPMLFNERKLKVKVTEKENSLDFDLYRWGEQIPIKCLSKSEKARLSLALLLTNRMATPSSKHTNVLVIDEVMDSVDTPGHDGVIKTLRHLMESTGVTSCFLVTQNPDVIKHKKHLFDQTWRVVKHPGKYSTIEFS